MKRMRTKAKTRNLDIFVGEVRIPLAESAIHSFIDESIDNVLEKRGAFKTLERRIFRAVANTLSEVTDDEVNKIVARKVRHRLKNI